jgi:hypothetical protein
MVISPSFKTKMVYVAESLRLRCEQRPAGEVLMPSL